MTQYSTTTSWGKIASAGNTVEVQNISTAPVKITSSASLPADTADGVVLQQGERDTLGGGALPNDLYAKSLSPNGGWVEVLPIGAAAGGGSGGAVTVADGADVAIGAKADAAVVDPSLAGTLVALLKGLIKIERPWQGVVALTVGTPAAVGRALRINCTAAGNVSLTYADASTETVAVNVGLTYLPGAITTVNTSGTTATATYANMQ